MRPTPSKKFSATTGNKLKGYSPAKPAAKNRLLSPEPGVQENKKRFSVNIDPASLQSLQSLAGKKKLYLPSRRKKYTLSRHCEFGAENFKGSRDNAIVLQKRNNVQKKDNDIKIGN